ncbi:hypothetical protein RCL_jg27633.t1 [Rhizophagus clarus]|uniref:Uncharacterized protein n=1 Tax=Rhizophagus clarus TaxID=94130 RepID=A0A8H3QYP4_9GLOM|nr:hypothetical protein RCL_jg27633.t1 [Rhizophagus clarus]
MDKSFIDCIINNGRTTEILNFFLINFFSSLQISTESSDINVHLRKYHQTWDVAHCKSVPFSNMRIEEA